MTHTEKVYVIISESGTKFSKFLKLFTHHRYTHVSISFAKDLHILYSFGRKNLIFPMFAGFTEEHPDKGVFGKYDVNLQVFELNITRDKFEKLILCVNKFAENGKQYRYNFLGLPFMYFNLPLERKYKYVCSQFVGKALIDSDIHDFGKSYSLVTPLDFYEIPMKKIFEGRLREYCAVS